MKKRSKPQINYFRFKHWTNKPYGVFNSLHRLIKIGVISVCYSIIVQGQASFAQDSIQKNKTIELDQAYVQAEKRQLVSEAGRIVQLISRSDIENIPASSLNDLLGSLAGLDIRNRGPHGLQADISIRGGNFDQVLILLNGINITDPQTGHHNADIPLNLADVDRIEVLQGAGARTYGPGAFSGAINIVTGTKKESMVSLNLEAGQHAYLNQQASTTIRKNNLGIYLSGSHAQSNGYVPSTDFNHNNFFIHTSYSTAQFGKIQMQAAYQNKAFGANSFYSANFKDQFEHTRTLFGSINWNKSWKKLDLDISAYWRTLFDHYELIRDSSYGRNFHKTEVPGAQMKLAYYGNNSKTSIGIGMRSEAIVSTNMGDLKPDPYPVHFANHINPKPLYTHQNSRWGLFYYLDQSFYWNKWTFSGGLQMLNHSVFSNKLSAGIDAGYQFKSNLKFVASVNTAQRIPTFTDLFYKSPMHIGSVMLKPEQSITFETAILYSKNRHKALLNLYNRQGKNIIDWVRKEVTDKWESKNLTQVNAWGVEFNWTYQIKSDWVQNIRFSALWQTQNKLSNIYESQYVMDQLKTKLTAGLQHKIIDRLSASWSWNVQQRQGGYTNTSKEYVPFSTLFLTHLQIQYTQALFQAYIHCSNLTNQKYMDIGNVEQPGLWLKTGLKVWIK